jgi:ribosomal protein L37E
MPNNPRYDPEGPDAADDDLMDEGFSWDTDTTTCPKCGAAVLEDQGRCNACGYWLTQRDRCRWPWWVVAVALLAAAGLLMLQVL